MLMKIIPKIKKCTRNSIKTTDHSSNSIVHTIIYSNIIYESLNYIVVKTQHKKLLSIFIQFSNKISHCFLEVFTKNTQTTP